MPESCNLGITDISDTEWRTLLDNCPFL